MAVSLESSANRLIHHQHVPECLPRVEYTYASDRCYRKKKLYHILLWPFGVDIVHGAGYLEGTNVCSGDFGLYPHSPLR
jgi:hypothetical protein